MLSNFSFDLNTKFIKSSSYECVKFIKFIKKFKFNKNNHQKSIK